MRVHVDLAGETDVSNWSERHARGEVADVLPYGFDKLEPLGITPILRTPLRNPAALRIARKVRGRLGQVDFVSVGRNALRPERRSADAVLCWDESTGFPAALLPGPPVVSGAAWLEDPELLRPAVRRMAAPALRRMAGIFQYSEPTARAVERTWGLRSGSVHSLNMGVDEMFYRPMPYPESGGIVMSVGDDRHRDHAGLVRIVEMVIDSGVPARLELATTRAATVPEHVGVLHHRRMEGAIRDLFGRSAVVAIVVRAGAGGVPGATALLEAMACARPVVITGNLGLAEYVEDGVTGILVPPGDEHAFRDAIASLLKDPAAARRMGLAARRAVEQRFTTGHLMGHVARILRASV